MFAQWGHMVYRRRRLVLLLSCVVLIGSIAALQRGGTLVSTNNVDVEAVRAAALVQSELPATGGGSSFTIVFGNPTLTATSPGFRNALEAAVAPLRTDSRVSAVRTPYDDPGHTDLSLVARDGKHALAIVSLKDDVNTAVSYYPALRGRIQSSLLSVVATGGVATQEDFNAILEQDLQRAEKVALPLVLVLLLLVFGTVVAAALPLVVGVLAVGGGLGGVYLLTRATSVSPYALNIVTLIGLGVAIDYSLFIVSRFRAELRQGNTVEASLSRSIATAGRAVAFSGLTVAIGLSGMLFYPGTFLPSVGLAGAIVVAFAVFYALTLLPAVLALLGRRVEVLRLPIVRHRSGGGIWYRLATGVMRRPLVALLPALAFVLLAASPIRQLRLAGGDISTLQPSAESRQGYDLLNSGFPEQEQNRVTVVLRFAGGQPLSAAHVGVLYDLSRTIAGLPNVLAVESPVDVDAQLGRNQYQALYAGPPAQLPAPLRDALRQSVGPHIAVLSVLTAQRAESEEARSLVRAIRALPIADGGQVLVTGDTSFDMDNVQFLFDRTPLALAFVMVVTYVVLFFLLGSVILPLEAVVSDLLSVAASFGALVWIFQQGHLSNQLHFIAAPIDPSVPVILFCIMFGLSMDYEVLLLSRIKEEYDRHGDNRRAVALGLQHSGGLITGAAMIMVAVFGAFALADSVIIKSIGLGLAIAVAIDATLVRALIVPAVMRLLGELNWWAPEPLVRLYGRLRLGEVVTGHEAIGLAGSAVEVGADYFHEPRPRSKVAPVGASVGADEEE